LVELTQSFLLVAWSPKTDEDPRAFTAHEAVAALVERTARLFRLLVASREGVHRFEAADADR
jgi:hypothetical protein